MSWPSEPVDRYFVDSIVRLERSGHGGRDLVHRPVLAPDRRLEIFDSQLGSRHLDFAARWLRSRGQGYYTIGSSGHEGNAAVAAALRPTDPALLHYRSGAFYLERARQVPGHDALRDVLLGVVAATGEPGSGGRHKVFGHPDLAVIPQTSTIASHLPRALGVAFSIARTSKLGVPSSWPADAITVCSFGDASANHSTALGAVNAALHASYQGVPVPLLLVCEDNGIGISVPTPRNWIAHTYRTRPGLEYFAADGSDVDEAMAVCARAVGWVRRHRRPAFLHLRTVRLMGHAGSDAEVAYRSPAAIAAEYEQDPLLATARTLVATGTLGATEVLELYDRKRQEVMAVAAEVSTAPPLGSTSAVMRPLSPPSPSDVACAARQAAPAGRRAAAFGGTLPEHEGGLTTAQAINRALADVLAARPQALLFGEDVAAKGGVYGVTRSLTRRFGAARVFDTLLDEQSILGLGLGAGLSGLLPIAEIQYLAYLHNAEDQLRGEGATLAFFSDGQYRNPMVVRIASYAYQKGFGGHFHNDNSVAVLRDIPGLVVASPARPDDAAAMLRTCVAAGVAAGVPSVFLEPIALYHTRDLHQKGDGAWLAGYPSPEHWHEAHVPLGSARTYGSGDDLTIVSFANGLFMSLRVAERLKRRGIACRVVDLRWLAPLPVDDLLREASATGKLLVVDETRRSGGVSEGVVTALVDAGYTGVVRRVASHDSFIPLGDAAAHVVLGEEAIEQAAVSLARA